MENRNGEKVLLKGKEYTITGTVAKSYIVEDASGRHYKVTPNMIERIHASDARKGRPVDASQYGSPIVTSQIPGYFKKSIEWSKMFKQERQLPNSNNYMEWASEIYAGLSPENLTCDGECSRTEVIRKQRELVTALRYIEKIAGRKIEEEETYKGSVHP